MKVVLIGKDGGQIWHDAAPAGDELTLTVVTTFKWTGEVVDDSRWGEVKMFKAVEHSEVLKVREELGIAESEQ